MMSEERHHVPPVVVPRWVQLVILPLGIVALWLLARAAGAVLLLFVVAGVLALILNPIVHFLQGRLRFPRGLAVFAVYIGLLMAFVGIGFLLANPIANQAEKFGNDVPRIIKDANSSLHDVQKYFDKHGISIEIEKQGQTALETLRQSVVGGTNDIVSFGGDLLTKVVQAGLALILVTVVSVYMLLYGQRIGTAVRRVMPPGDGSPEDDYPTRVQKAVTGYLRGQFLFSVLMGTGAGLLLYLFGILGIFPAGETYAVAFGIFFGLCELIPFVGPILGALPPILVALFQDPLTALWVALLFVGLQQIEGHVVAPQIFGHALRINPLLVIFALLLGGETYGVLGALISLPLAAVARETAVYLRRHLVLEPWGPESPLPLRGPPPVTCAECGAVAARTDSYCRSCGAPLGSPVVTRQ